MKFLYLRRERLSLLRAGRVAGAAMNDLTASKLQKLQEQRELSDKLNTVLTKEGGLIQSAQQTCKNLEVAVAVSKRPGFFEYYQPSEEVKRVYQTNECNNLVRRIARAQKELDVLDQEIQLRADAREARAAPFQPSVGNLEQWFQSYGRPKNAMPDGILTTFQKDKKIYGGTAHHRAFKTQAMTMKKGRGTN
jgi:hypothetical protein